MTLQQVINRLTYNEYRTFTTGLGATGRMNVRDITKKSIRIALLGAKIEESCGFDAQQNMFTLGESYLAEVRITRKPIER